MSKTSQGHRTKSKTYRSKVNYMWDIRNATGQWS